MEGHHCIGMLEIAEIYFNTSSENLKQLLRDFFNSMDEDHDQKVSLSEFLNNMKEGGLVKAENPPEMFKLLDVNRDGSLDFKEVVALYYVIKSGRPFCRGCGKFIPGMFFSCLICFDNEDDKFCVCPKCFTNENKSYNHKHMPDHFLDNFTLLEAKRKMAIDTRKPPPPPLEEPKKKSTLLLRLLESEIGATVVARAEAVADSGAAAAADFAAAAADSCSIM
ncbi:hypothetical protein LOK49_LG06G02580 [Camellia lanceoleosa]|uniref:Uncharacterized protein n=1 Tax=Camellia lanceoleosa TaxID=1840588 RepID=A0ACC0H923_9ERIC|nr:hypothetical protein LOK49_LG06G02580 [Camellia lanceoleosa]